jgi:APA family basic amino acid/polyamine antiporter
MPGHPYTTMLFTLAFWLLALSTIAQFPRSAGIGVLLMLAGVPAYLLWRRRALSDDEPGGGRGAR